MPYKCEAPGAAKPSPAGDRRGLPSLNNYSIGGQRTEKGRQESEFLPNGGRGVRHRVLPAKRGNKEQSMLGELEYSVFLSTNSIQPDLGREESSSNNKIHRETPNKKNKKNKDPKK